MTRTVQQVQAAVTKDFPDATFSKQDAVSGKVSLALLEELMATASIIGRA